METSKKHIDVMKAFREGNPKLAKMIPRFATRWVEKLIHQDQMNFIINKYIDYVGIDFQPKIIEEFNLKIDVQGVGNLPESSRGFFASNHPFGILDGLILTYFVGQKYGDLKAIGNDAFLLIPELKPLIAAVNVYGRSSKEYVIELDKVYKSDVAITHFPAGEVSRIYNGKIEDAPWQKSFITKAIESKRDIIPFYFHGQNSALFYNIFRFRKCFGIKTNLELVLLPREMFKKKDSEIRVVIGKPIAWQTFDKRMSHYDWAQKVRQYVYSLNETPNSDFIKLIEN
ncbi:MAG: glycerol acyltransferase [Salinivirgaceae bacterium]|nr:glycerol acyltransferase [Salinivirgaceae bacterium]